MHSDQTAWRLCNKQRALTSESLQVAEEGLHGLFQTVQLNNGPRTFASLDADTTDRMALAEGFVSHSSARSVSRPEGYFQATLWKGDAFIEQLAATSRGLVPPSDLSLAIENRVGHVRIIDQPQTTVSSPGVLSVIHLAARTRIGPRIERIIRRAQKSVAGLASYGGSCVLSPADGSSDLILLTWVHRPNDAELNRKFALVRSSLESGDLLTVVKADLATHVAWRSCS